MMMIYKAYNKGFKAGLELYMSKKEPLKKDALEILIDELLCAEIEAQSITTIDKSDYFDSLDELGYSSDEPDGCISISEGPVNILE